MMIGKGEAVADEGVEVEAVEEEAVEHGAGSSACPALKTHDMILWDPTVCVFLEFAQSPRRCRSRSNRVLYQKIC